MTRSAVTERTVLSVDVDWARRYANGLLITDVAIVFWAVFGSQLAWFGLTEGTVAIDGSFQEFAFTYTFVSVAIATAWILFLSAAASRDSRIVGTGTTEYRRIVNPSLMLFGLCAIVSYLLKIELARGYFVTALPVGLSALLISRWLWRQFLTSRRRSGKMSAKVLLIGSAESVLHIGRELTRLPEAGYAVAGACIADRAGNITSSNFPFPVFGTVDDVQDAIAQSGADTVVVTSSDHLPPMKLRELSWSLEPGKQHLVMAPALTDIAGPRIHTRPVAGLPLIHVETPRYEGGARAIKRAFDFAAALVLIAVLAPTLLVIAIGVRLSSPGPILFRQNRIGLRGQGFKMLKFRSMVTNADDQLMQLLAMQGTSETPLFKLTNDPRITRLGSILRRYSLDELPQLFNVVQGKMSLVGPRPQVPNEVALYDNAAARRLNVKPGITGLWQTSGRSRLTWEESVRLDLYYVENWSLTSDLLILGRTLKAVLLRDGAI